MPHNLFGVIDNFVVFYFLCIPGGKEIAGRGAGREMLYKPVNAQIGVIFSVSFSDGLVQQGRIKIYPAKKFINFSHVPPLLVHIFY
jgi:hypothetical protein